MLADKTSGLPKQILTSKPAHTKVACHGPETVISKGRGRGRGMLPNSDEVYKDRTASSSETFGEGSLLE